MATARSPRQALAERAWARSHLHDLFGFVFQQVVDQFDVVVGCLLNVIRPALGLVLAHAVGLLDALDQFGGAGGALGGFVGGVGVAVGVCDGKMAEGAGFEPAIRFPVYTLSRRASSTTRAGLRVHLR